MSMEKVEFCSSTVPAQDVVAEAVAGPDPDLDSLVGREQAISWLAPRQSRPGLAAGIRMKATFFPENLIDFSS